MGIFDMFGGSPEKRIKSAQKKVTEKYGPPENRQKAIEQLLELATPEAISALMDRFTVNAEPSITDAEEKQYTYKSIVDLGEKAIEPIKGFMVRSHSATSWGLKMLRELTDEKAVVAICIELLTKLGNEYTRDPEKKTVLVTTLGDFLDPRITPALLPFLDDPADDVRIATATVLAKQKDEAAREPLLKTFVESPDRARVLAAVAAALANTGFAVQGYREKIEKGLPEGYLLDKAGVVKRR